MLVYPPSIDFIVVFLSCLRAGIVPVPVYPPSACLLFLLPIDPTGLKKNVQLFSGIQSNCQAKVALSNGFVCSCLLPSRSYIHAKMLLNMKSFFSRSGVHWPELQWISTDSLITPNDLPTVPEGCSRSPSSP